MSRPGDEARRVLTAVIGAEHSTATMKEWLREQDAPSLNACLYLTLGLGINPLVLPRLVPLIDRERSEAGFVFQNANF